MGEQTDELGMIADPIPDTKQLPDDESSTAHGALWITVGTVSIGLSNYGYSLLLTHLLTVAEYSVFSAGQGLILWATNIAAVSVPWVLAQALARARSERERNSAIRFAKLLSAGTGHCRGARRWWHSHGGLWSRDSRRGRGEYLRHLPRYHNDRVATG